MVTPPSATTFSSKIPIEDALWRIDETIAITEFSLEMIGRDAVVRFKAINSEGEEVGGEYTYGG